MQKHSQPNGKSRVQFKVKSGQQKTHSSRQTRDHQWVQIAALLLSSSLLSLAADSTPSATTIEQAISSPEFVRVEPGSFFPRKTRSEERHADGTTAHKVEISRPFLMSRTEVTNSQMLSMLKLGLELNYIEANRGSVSMPAKRGETTITVLNFQNSDIAFTDGQFQIAQGKEAHPCTGVTWYGAQVYANLYSESLNLKPAIDVHTWECDFMGAGFRLPTESEWEYAHQAGEETNSLQHPSKLPALAADQNGESRPVDTDPKNPWGLVGMDGNVSEWCWDWFGASRHSSKIDPSGPAEGWRKAVRGKHFLRNTEPAQNAVRISGLPFNENKFWGFRIVRTLVEQE